MESENMLLLIHTPHSALRNPNVPGFRVVVPDLTVATSIAEERLGEKLTWHDNLYMPEAKIATTSKAGVVSVQPVEFIAF